MATLRIFHKESPVEVLGPGRRAVVWTQGCPFRCAGCISPESLDITGGEAAAVDDLTAWILAQRDIEGVTFSGGDPMAQAEQLCRLVDAVRTEVDLGVVCYTGYTLEHLQTHGTPAQRAFLERIDLLIDGPYIESLHADLLWRGSANQRLISLTDRYTGAIPDSDRGCGLQVFVTQTGGVCIAGVPPEPGFGRELQDTVGRGSDGTP